MFPISPKMLHEILNAGRFDRERLEQEAGEPIFFHEVIDSAPEWPRLARLRRLFASLRPARPLIRDWSSR